MKKLICIRSNPSLLNSNQLTEGKTYEPFFYMAGFAPGQVLVLLVGTDGIWELDRFLTVEVEKEITDQIFDALKGNTVG